MMFLLVAAACVTLFAAAVWLLAAFALSWRHDARCAATLFLPVLAVSGWIWRLLTAGRASLTPGWTALFLILGVITGSLAVIPALGTWLILERRLGHRAR